MDSPFAENQSEEPLYLTNPPSRGRIEEARTPCASCHCSHSLELLPQALTSATPRPENTLGSDPQQSRKDNPPSIDELLQEVAEKYRSAAKARRKAHPFP